MGWSLVGWLWGPWGPKHFWLLFFLSVFLSPWLSLRVLSFDLERFLGCPYRFIARAFSFCHGVLAKSLHLALKMCQSSLGQALLRLAKHTNNSVNCVNTACRHKSSQNGTEFVFALQNFTSYKEPKIYQIIQVLHNTCSYKLHLSWHCFDLYRSTMSILTERAATCNQLCLKP